MNDLIEVRTLWGRRLHLAKADSRHTLCWFPVSKRREGLQWDDPRIRRWPLCQRCVNKAGVRES